MNRLVPERDLGGGGIRIPRLMLSAAPLANACKTRPEQVRGALCVEWLTHSRPVVVELADDYDAGTAARILGQVLRRLEIAPDALVVCRRVNIERLISDAACVDDCRAALGESFSPAMLCVDGVGPYLQAAATIAERARRLESCRRAFHSLAARRSAHACLVGAAAADFAEIELLRAELRPHWIALARGPTPWHHPRPLVDRLRELAQRGVAVIPHSIFHGGFLAGGAQFDGGPLDPFTEVGRSLLDWRKAFVSLCYGMGVSPVAACLQFTLSAPAVASVRVNTSCPERVAELVSAACTPLPTRLCAALKTEGLVHADWQFGE